MFQEIFGTLQNFKAHISLILLQSANICKAWPIPYTIKAKVEKELDRLVAQETQEPVQILEWASPIVSVAKSDKKSVRINFVVILSKLWTLLLSQTDTLSLK